MSAKNNIQTLIKFVLCVSNGSEDCLNFTKSKITKTFLLYYYTFGLLETVIQYVFFSPFQSTKRSILLALQVIICSHE